MIYVVGYNDITEEYKLFNTDVTLENALKRCSFNNLDVIDLVEYRHWVADMGRLRSQHRAVDCVEFRILYYSCDFDREKGLIYNIRLHLTNGQVVHPDVLRNDKNCSYQESGQLERFTGDSIRLEHEITVFMGDAYLQIDTKFVELLNTFFYYFKINGTNEILSIVSGSADSIWLEKDNYCFSTVNPGYVLTSRANGQDYCKTFIYILGYDSETENFRCVTRSWRCNKGSDLLDVRFSINKLNKWYLASRNIDCQILDWEDWGLKGSRFDGFDNLNYLLKHTTVSKIDSTLSYYTSLLIPCINELQGMSNALHTFGVSNGNLKITVDGELKALVGMTDRDIDLDISDIKEIAHNALYGIDAVTIGCTGDCIFSGRMVEKVIGTVFIFYSNDELEDRLSDTALRRA